MRCSIFQIILFKIFQMLCLIFRLPVSDSGGLLSKVLDKLSNQNVGSLRCNVFGIDVTLSFSNKMNETGLRRRASVTEISFTQKL